MSRRPALELAAVVTGWIGLVLVVFRPTAADLGHTLPAFRGFAGDAIFHTWGISHVSRALLHDPFGVWHAGIMHPARYTLAYGDHMIGQALLGLPVWLVSGNPLLEFNLLLLGSYVAGAAAMYVYARGALGVGATAAIGAGLIVAFTPFRFHSPLWPQVLWHAFVPLALFFWLRWLRHGLARHWVLWIACWFAHSLMGLYLTLYFGVVMSALAVTALVWAPTRTRPDVALGTIAGGAAAAILHALVLWPYVVARAGHDGLRMGLDTPLAFLLPGRGTISSTLLGISEGSAFGPGLPVWGLLLLGLIATRRGWRPGAVTPPPADEAGTVRDVATLDAAHLAFVQRVQWIGLALVLALVFVPIDAQRLLPGFDMLRNTNRAFMIGLVFLGALAATGLQTLRALPGGRILAGALVLALALDMGTPPRGRQRLPVAGELPDAVAFLAALPPDAIVYDHRIGLPGAIEAMYLAIHHGRRMPTGYSGFIPPGAIFSTLVLGRFPSPQALHLLTRLGVDYVWTHPVDDAAVDRMLAALAATPVTVAARFGSDLVLDVRTPLPEFPPPRRLDAIDPSLWGIDATGGGTLLGRLTDGDPSTIWEHEASGPARRQPTLTIDLRRDHVVAAVVVRTPPRGTDFLPLASISADGRTWQPLEAGFLPEPFDELYGRPPAVVTLVARTQPTVARYVRLTGPDLAFWRSPWHVAEVEVLEVTRP